MATPDNGLAALVYAPCEVTAKVAGGQEVRIVEETNYPFEETIRFTYRGPSRTPFPLHLRIPEWVEGASLRVNDAELDPPTPGTITKLPRSWDDGDRIELRLPAPIRTSRWHENSAAIERGPLVYALRRNEEWTPVQGTAPYRDYEVRTPDPWNFGLLNVDVENPTDAYEVRRADAPIQPWSLDGAPHEITARVRRIAHWQRYGGNTGPIPWSPTRSSEPDEEVKLVPYGCTTIRISQFPVVPDE
jgi:hypothetical protein